MAELGRWATVVHPGHTSMCCLAVRTIGTSGHASRSADSADLLARSAGCSGAAAASLADRDAGTRRSGISSIEVA